MRTVLVVAALVSIAPLAGAQAPAQMPTATSAPAAWTLDRLMSTLAQYKSGHATFVETKYLAMASAPIESSGELTFAAPDHLEKITTNPKPERLIVDGDKLTVERNQHKYTLALAQYPELDAFIESIRATLAGNRYALEDMYRVALSGRGDDWALRLTPRDARMAKLVSTITLEGERHLLHTVTIQQADGDHSVMRLQNAAGQ